jgi:hydroxyethylthiazole kinase-like sugar kinase family protein
MDFIANSLLAIGAAPIMSEYESDLEDLVKISNAIYINVTACFQKCTGLLSSTITGSN